MAAADVRKNTIYNVIKSVSGIIYPLITFPYISRVLLTENVGKINFSNSIVSYFSLIASLGISTYAIRECSKFREDREKLGNTASQVLSINLWSTLLSYVVLAVTLVAARPLEHYRELIIIQSLTILFSTLGADWLNSAMEDFRYITLRTAAMQLVSLLLMFLFVRRPEDYMRYAVISVLSSSGANVINIFYRRKYCRTRFVLHIDWKKHVPPILLLFSLILSQTIYTSSDTTILGLVKGDYQVGLYGTSVRIYNIVNMLVSSVSSVVLPQLSAAFAAKNYRKVNDLLEYALGFIIVLGVPCIVGLNAIAEEIIVLLAGEAYREAAVSLHILTIALGCSFIGGWIGNMMLLPAGKEKICLKASVMSAAANVILNLIFIPVWGLNAAAATTAFSEFISVMIVRPHVDPEIHVHGLRKMLTAPIVGGICIVLISGIVRYMVQSAYLVSVITIVLSVAAYLAILILLENEFAINFLRPILERLKRKMK